MMQIEHVALWTEQLEELKSFYETHFGAVAGEQYLNPRRQFESYFLRFASGARLEIMRVPGLQRPAGEEAKVLTGYAHLAFSAGSRERVDEITRELRAAGYEVLDGPHTTGDGYYESSVLDPDGNRLEITV